MKKEEGKDRERDGGGEMIKFLLVAVGNKVVVLTINKIEAWSR